MTFYYIARINWKTRLRWRKESIGTFARRMLRKLGWRQERQKHVLHGAFPSFERALRKLYKRRFHSIYFNIRDITIYISKPSFLRSCHYRGRRTFPSVPPSSRYVPSSTPVHVSCRQVG